MSDSGASKLSTPEDQIVFQNTLAKRIQLLLKTHKEGKSGLTATIKEAYRELRPDWIDNSSQDMQSDLLQVTLANLFAKKEALWIHPRTECGNDVPAEILIEAYGLWGTSRRVARQRGVDPAAAADAMAKATHAVVDKLIGNKDHPEQIRDIRKYIFAAFRHETSAVALAQGFDKTVRIGSFHPARTRNFSDSGKHARIMYYSILYRELLDSLDHGCKSIAHSRLSLEHGWAETSECMKMQAKTAQKKLSRALRKGLGIGMRKLQFRGYRKSSIARTA